VLVAPIAAENCCAAGGVVLTARVNSSRQMPVFGRLLDGMPFADKRSVSVAVRVLTKGSADSLEVIHHVRQHYFFVTA
jgi:hypothetical protein